jgi:BirA family biotin operon repressor/biotin-[acetyl-CoA-carboxylase] ligase
MKSNNQVPEPLSPGEIMTALGTQEIGSSIVYRSAVTSTMDVALEEIQNAAPHGTVVIAESQTHGKGRLEREWLSPPGGAYLSIILYPPKRLTASLTMIASLAVADCIEEITAIKPDIKWPNDVLVGGKKVCGILAKSGATPKGDCYAVLGIGINVNTDFSSQPDVAAIATSLSAATGNDVSRVAIIVSLLEHFEKRYEALVGGVLLWQEWKARLVTLGKFVSVRSGKEVFTGLAESVTPDGSLLLRMSDGTIKEIPAGDVTLRT